MSCTSLASLLRLDWLVSYEHSSYSFAEQASIEDPRREISTVACARFDSRPGIREALFQDHFIVCTQRKDI